VFVTFYQWRIKSDKQEQFIHAWTEMTKHLQQDTPQLTAFLGQTPQGTFIGSVFWPSQQAWESQNTQNIDVFLQNRLMDAIEEVENVIPIQVIKNIK